MIGYFSRGIERLRFLPEILEESCEKVSIRSNRPNAILGWGLKPSADRARSYAEKHSLPYISLEDAFVRSFGLGVKGWLPHGIAVDYRGIYYDATRASDLEQLILQSEDYLVTSERARHCINLLRTYRLSKYNHAPETTWQPAPGARYVLVVDQTAGDASVQYGLGSADAFTEMLNAAIEENPGAHIIVKTHPDVIAGKKKGYLVDASQDSCCELIAEDCNPWSIFEHVETVYTVTSQLGFEALMAGCKVVCFGMPFYAGWGLTDDRIKCERRGIERSLEQVFYAAYLQYCRYINPYTAERCELEDTIALIASQKQHAERYKGTWIAVGFSHWKTKFINAYLGAFASVSYQPSINDVSKTDRVNNLLVWSSRLDSRTEEFAKENGIKLWLMEDGFVRSVGLGVDLVRPLSLVIDRTGIYYDSTRPSDLENYLNEHTFDDSLLQRAAEIRAQLVDLRLSKYNVGNDSQLSFPTDKRILLVPGQVETDASIAKGSPVVQTNSELLRRVRESNPEAFIVYKPHPDVLSGGRLGGLEKSAAQYFDEMVSDVSITELFDYVDEVHTMSSLAGFEALLRGLHVVTYGMPFYAGWGLTVDLLTCERRQRTLTLDQLVAATLILYPIYVDPQSGEVCDAETVVSLLDKGRGNVQGPSLKTRVYRLYRNIFEGKR